MSSHDLLDRLPGRPGRLAVRDDLDAGGLPGPLQDAPGGWKVVIYYDCGALDYITHFVTPEGEVLDFWDWPESHERDLLINWRGVWDRARLMEIHQKGAAAFVRARVGDWAQVWHEPGLISDGYEVVAVDDGRPGQRLCVQGPAGRTWVSNRNVIGAVRPHRA